VRDSLAFREKAEPDAWTTFNSSFAVSKARAGRATAGCATPFSAACLNDQLLTRLLFDWNAIRTKKWLLAFPWAIVRRKKPSKTRHFLSLVHIG
jgi:hypothetical protein